MRCRDGRHRCHHTSHQSTPPAFRRSRSGVNPFFSCPRPPCPHHPRPPPSPHGIRTVALRRACPVRLTDGMSRMSPPPHLANASTGQSGRNLPADACRRHGYPRPGLNKLTIRPLRHPCSNHVVRSCAVYSPDRSQDSSVSGPGLHDGRTLMARSRQGGLSPHHLRPILSRWTGQSARSDRPSRLKTVRFWLSQLGAGLPLPASWRRK